MMEESSDEQPEIISHEEAAQAEKEASQTATSVTPTKPAVGVAAPAPLPSFLASPGGVQTPTPQVKSSPSPQKAKPSTVTTPSVSAPVISPGISSAAAKPLPTAPGQMETPFEASSSIPIQDDTPAPQPQSPGGQGGSLFGWISGNSLVSKVMEKTKSSVESVITTLDPGMKEVIKSGGEINVMVTSTKETKVGAIREAFQQVFGRATVTGMESQATTAAQPVGCTAGLKGAEERIQNLRQSGKASEDQPVVSVEGFIMELLPDRWYELSCLVLQDPIHRIDLQTFSQPTLIPAEYVLSAQDKTSSSYPLRWSGLAVSIGQVIEEAQPHIGHADWQKVLVGVSRRESLLLAARGLAYMYQQRLPTSFIS